MIVTITFIDSIEQVAKTIETEMRNISGTTLCEALAKHFAGEQESSTIFRCEKLETIHSGQFLFIVHSEDLISCKEVGFINIKK